VFMRCRVVDTGHGGRCRKRSRPKALIRGAASILEIVQIVADLTANCDLVNLSRNDSRTGQKIVSLALVIFFKPLVPMARQHQRTLSGAFVGARSTKANLITPTVTLSYIARSHDRDPCVRISIFREHGSVILDISHSTIAEICEPNGDGPENLVQAFRQSLPELWRSLNTIVANTPSGSVVFVTPRMLRSHRILCRTKSTSVEQDRIRNRQKC